MITVGVEVENGVGSVELPASFHGDIILICIRPPDNTHPSYDFYFEDQDGYGVGGSASNNGRSTLPVAFPIPSGVTGAMLYIINASVDGYYFFRLYQGGD